MRRKLAGEQTAVQYVVSVTQGEFYVNFLSVLVCQYNGGSSASIGQVDNFWE